MTNGYPEPAISRLEESTVKAKSLISIGLSPMKTELNTGLELMPLKWTDSIPKCTIWEEFEALIMLRS